MRSERISYESVVPISCDSVNVLEYLKKSSIILVTYEEWLTGLRENEPVEMPYVKSVYIPIDPYWMREGILEGVSRDVTLICDGVDIDRMRNFGSAKLYLAMPAEQHHPDGIKTTQEEYMQYLKARKELFKDLETLVI